MENKIKKLNKLKIAVSLTLPSHHAVITEKLKGYKEPFYGVLEWKDS